jgi:hypothetical protein
MQLFCDNDSCTALRRGFLGFQYEVRAYLCMRKTGGMSASGGSLSVVQRLKGKRHEGIHTPPALGIVQDFRTLCTELEFGGYSRRTQAPPGHDPS